MRVLLVLGETENPRAVLRELSKEGATVHETVVRTLDALAESLGNQTWDVVLADQVLDGFTPTEVVDHLSAEGLDVPLLVLAEELDGPLAVQAMAHGAKDYILRTSLFRLLPAVLREMKAARMRSRQLESMRLSEALNDIHAVIHSSSDVDEVLQRALDETCRVLGADNGAIQMREGDRWVVRYQSGMPEDHRGVSFSTEEMYVLPEILRTMDPVVIEDLQADDRYEPQSFDMFAVRSTMAIPLVSQGEVMGLVFVSKAASPSGFSAETVDFGRKLGAAVSLAIGNADALLREREYADLSDTLSHINEILLAPFDPVTTMSRVVAQARELFDADSARIIERAEGGWVFAHVVGESTPSDSAHEPTDDALRSMQPALENAESVFIEDSGQASFPRSFPSRASIALPLVAGERVVAVLALGFARPRPFSDRDREFAERLRSAVSLALENEERLREESSIATLTDALERAEAGIYSAQDEDRIVSLALKTATLALCATGACAIWCERRDVITLPQVPRLTSVDLDSEASLAQLVDGACVLSRHGTERAAVGVLPIGSANCDLLAVTLPSTSDRVALVLERRGGDFTFKREELSFAERLAEVAGLAMENVRLARDRERLVSTREEWLAGISHDLRTPLAAVRGYAELLAVGGDEGVASVRDKSQRILEQTDRIERMIVDMLLAFRIRSNALPVTPESVPLGPLLEDVRSTVLADRRARGRGIEIAMASDFTVLADPTLLERAITNLAMNAVVHNPPGILISLWAIERDGRGVVQVTDDGRGIDAATMKRLFVRYHRASASGEGAAGAGLGMPIARQLIEAMGGTLEVESTEGVGTTATITLPLPSE